MAELPKQELLAKLLAMTTSTNDSEALVAIRKANALLLSAGWTWEKLIREKIRVVEDPFKNLQPRATSSDPSYRMSTPPPRPPTPPPPQRPFVSPQRPPWAPYPKPKPPRPRRPKRPDLTLADLDL